MLVRVRFREEAYNFCPFIYVDAEAPMAAGREIWGARRARRSGR
jgi:acetoacetate decarboxylase